MKRMSFGQRSERPPSRLLTRLRRAVAVGLHMGLGCSGRYVGSERGESELGTTTANTGGASASDAEGDDGTTGPSSADSSSSEAVSDGAESEVESDDDSGDDGPRFDLGPYPDIPPTECLGPHLDDGTTTGAEDPAESWCDLAEPESMYWAYACIPKPVEPEGQTRHCDVRSPACIAERLLPIARETVSSYVYDVLPVACTHNPEVEDACCYWYEWTGYPPGRPLLVEGEARLATPIDRDDWTELLDVEFSQLDRETRVVLAELWTRDGLHEHAAVASFARFALQLLTLGAPAKLVDSAQRAMGEEIEHARFMFSLAGVLRGQPVGPGPLDLSGAVLPTVEREAVALALAREACIAETISLMQLKVATRGLPAGPLRARFERLIEQEAEHVELGWRALAWILAAAPETTRTRVADCFRAAARARPLYVAPPSSNALGPGALAKVGRLTADRAERVAQLAVDQLVRPLAHELLAGLDSKEHLEGAGVGPAAAAFHG